MYLRLRLCVRSSFVEQFERHPFKPIGSVGQLSFQLFIYAAGSVCVGRKLFPRFLVKEACPDFFEEGIYAFQIPPCALKVVIVYHPFCIRQEQPGVFNSAFIHLVLFG